jgi:four helix bundle protein
MPTFRDLRVWQRSHALALELFRRASDLPVDARHILGDDLRRSAARIATWVAAASRCMEPAVYAAALSRAEAALAQTESLLLLALDLGHLPPELTSSTFAEIDGIGRSLAHLRARVLDEARTNGLPASGQGPRASGEVR